MRNDYKDPLQKAFREVGLTTAKRNAVQNVGALLIVISSLIPLGKYPSFQKVVDGSLKTIAASTKEGVLPTQDFNEAFRPDGKSTFVTKGQTYTVK